MRCHELLRSLPNVSTRRKLHGFRTGEKTTVDRVHDGLCADLAPAKEPAVETFDSVFASLHRREFEIDVALGVGI